MERLQPDGVVPSFDTADLHVHEITRLEQAVTRRTVDENGTGAGGKLRRYRGVIRPGAAHRILNLGRQRALGDTGARACERRAQADVRVAAGTAEAVQLER
jgi:hypothetical protein